MEAHMNIHQMIRRSMDPVPWEQEGTIAWDDPDFSRRSLREHLSQKHDSASRRIKLIQKHVNWINRVALAGQTSKILDLGCGPGLYTSRLADLGHTCVGIDFSPAAIEYANAQNVNTLCRYRCEDIRVADYGSGFDLVMLVFGSFNEFRPEDANLILAESSRSLKKGGKILLEVSGFESVEQMGNQPSMWYSERKGLFSDDPYLCLMENFWNEETRVATERYYIIHDDPEEKDKVDLHINSTQAYEDQVYSLLLKSAGFKNLEFIPSLTGSKEPALDGLFVILAVK
jgi:SAM-dependent methyltransferase